VSEFGRYLRKTNGQIACALVLGCGLLIGYFVYRTFVNPLPRQYNVNFGTANWIQLPTAAEASYFRKDLYISNPIDHAYLSIASSGSYQLFVNNILIDSKVLPAARPANVYDLVGLLSPGKNVIAVYVSGDWSFGPRQIIVRGAYSEAGSDPHEFVSDSSWKVSPVGQSIPRTVYWSASQYDDTSWQNAEEIKQIERWSTIERLLFDPRLIEEEPLGNWISSSSDGDHDETFSGQFELPPSTTGGWLRVASNGSYDVVINGREAIFNPSIRQAELFGPFAPLPLGSGNVVTYQQLQKIVDPDSGLPGAKSRWTVAVNAVATAPLPTYQATRLYSGSSTSSAALTDPLQAEVQFPGQQVTQIADQTRLSSYAIKSNTIGVTSGLDVNQLSARESRGPHLSLQTLQPPLAFDEVPPLAPPSFEEIAPQAAPSAPQVVPRADSPGPIPGAALLFTAYDISDYLHSGANTISIHVDSISHPAVLLADGLADLSDGTLSRFGTNSTWHSALTSRGGEQISVSSVTILGKYDTSPWGPPICVAPYTIDAPGEDISAVAFTIATLTTTTTLIFLLWLVPIPLIHPDKSGLEAYWNSHSILHLPVVVVLLGILLISYDARVPYDWCFQPKIIVGLLLAFIAGRILLPTVPIPNNRAVHDQSVAFTRRQWWCCAMLVLITAAGTVVRAWNINTAPLGHDEVQMFLLSKSIAHRGFPYLVGGSYTRLMSTYELVPYPIAISAAIFGPAPMAYRLPALLFGSLTIALIGWVGRRMFDWRVGLMAALIWAFLPIPIYWSQDGFYLSQEAFLALATFWLFYEAISGSVLNTRLLKLSAFAMVLTYLSWEASGFIIPTLFAGMLVLKWGQWEWFSNRVLWKTSAMVATVVIVQLCFRQITLTPNYLGIVKDLSELSSPSFVALDRLTFDPFYYLESLFLVENHVVLTCVALAALPLAFRSSALLYLYTCLLSLYLCYTVFLDHYAPRYCFNWLPLLVLTASAGVADIYDALTRFSVGRIVGYIRTASLALGLILIVLSANGYVLKLFRIAPDPTNPVWFGRIGVPFKANYADCDRYVARNLQPGDAVVTRAPHVFFFTTGRLPDYSINPWMVFRMFYDGGLQSPGYIDKWSGVKVIRSLSELRDLQTRAARVWVISDLPQPYPADVITYLQLEGRPEYESTRQEVILLNGVATACPDQSQSGSRADSCLSRAATESP
jgi:4-amino-4-deoxy-L-arabinose transferase-like glycosyltransferase